jgi:hypothetical protein
MSPAARTAAQRSSAARFAIVDDAGGGDGASAQCRFFRNCSLQGRQPGRRCACSGSISSPPSRARGAL